MQTHIVQVVKNKNKNDISSKKEKYMTMTYCLRCREKAVDIGPKKVTMTNKMIRQKSIYVNCFLINQDF